MLAKLAGFLLLMLTYGAIQAPADSVYEIIGTLTISGSSSNPSVGESINYSFELDYSSLLPGVIPTLVGTPIVTSFGPLGTLGLGYPESTGVVLDAPIQGYIAFFGPGVEVDIFGSFVNFPNEVFNGPTVDNGQDGSAIYTCLIPAVCSEFYPGIGNCQTCSSNGNGQNGGSGLWWYGTANASVYLVSTPEPGTVCLFVLGGLALCLAKRTLAH
jgi:hypothetical protein